MKANLKKIINYAALFFVSLVSAYALWAFSGMAMLVLLIATSPITSAFESLTLDYSVWAVIMALLLVPVVYLFSTIRPLRCQVWWRAIGYLWVYLLPLYLVFLGMIFMVNSILLYQVSWIVIFVFSIWYFIKFKSLVLKAK